MFDLFCIVKGSKQFLGEAKQFLMQYLVSLILVLITRFSLSDFYHYFVALLI